MKKFILLVALFGSSVFATDYQREEYRVGGAHCHDFKSTEREYMNPNSRYSEMVKALFYAECLLVKGEYINDKNLVLRGTEILENMVLVEGNLVANYLMAEYHYSDGAFKGISYKNLHIAAEHYSLTLVAIRNFGSHYPTPEYRQWEKDSQIEVEVHRRLAWIYIAMFYKGLAGDWALRASESPNYKENHELNTYPDYRKGLVASAGDGLSSIDLAIIYARDCKNLPMKPHFNEVSRYFIETCAVNYEGAKKLKEIQIKRQEILSQDRCKEVNAEGYSLNCPELDELDEEVESVLDNIKKEKKEILRPIKHKLV